MAKEIVKDIKFLSQVSKDFNFVADKPVIKELLDTANKYKEDCAGLAAIQIGYPVKAFIVKNQKTNKFNVYINPVIVARSPIKIKCVEGCLSIDGEREVTRNEWVELMYRDINDTFTMRRFEGVEGQAIQHEYDHLLGKTILKK